MPTIEEGKGTIGLGSVVQIGPATATAGSGNEVYVTIGQLMSFKPSGQEASVQKYNILNGGLYTKKLATIRDAGQVELEIVRLGNDAGQTALAAAFHDLSGQPYDFKVQLPLNPETGQTTAGDVVTFSAIVSKYNPIESLEADKIQMVSATLDLVTDLVVTAGS